MSVKGNGTSGDGDFRRLPSSALPTHYDLTIKASLETLAFTGSLKVKTKIVLESSEIVLNSAELKIFGVEWTWEGPSNDEKLITPYAVNLDAENERVQFVFDPPLGVGSGVLKMDFTGELNDKLKGFYHSKYKASNGEERFSAVTQFAPTDARRCFPCWDEPGIKSSFDVTLIAPKDRVAISNTPVKRIEAYEGDGNLQSITFETTPIMSTYLLAFVVGEFDFVEGITSDGIHCRVYTPVGKKAQGQFALDVTTRVIPYYSDYFQIPYPLSKIDLIAVPDCFYGAMENWGLLIYRETALLVDEKESSAISRQYVALVVGHEIAHQWFGNLVTMEWWTHLWLNEGYASFVEFMCVEKLFPEYDIWTQFVTDTHIPALELDCLDSSHPIEVEVAHPSEIDEIFDVISYNKGASIIRMLHYFIGDENFRRGMNLYLTRHQYRNASTLDLWKALGEASNLNVAEIMGSWTKQMGFPVISVRDITQEESGSIFTLSQQKFSPNPASRLSFAGANWQVPLSFSKRSSSPNEGFHKVLMDQEVMTVRLEHRSADWVKINPGLFGFYRVHYPSDVLSQFLPGIESMELPPLDRLGLLDDTFALAQAGQTTTVDVLKLLRAFVNEDNYIVWTAVTKIIGTLHSLLQYSNNDELVKAFTNFGKLILCFISDNVGWEPKPGEGPLRAMLRAIVLNRMVTLEDEEALMECKGRFELQNSGYPILPDLRTVVFKGVLSDADEKTLDTFVEMYLATDNQEEQVRIARGFASIKSKELMKKVAEFAISPKVRKQDTIIILSSIGIGKDGRDFVWEFFKNHWKLLHDNYPTHHVGKMLKSTMQNFATEEKATEIESFFHDHPFRGTEMSVKQAVEQIRLNEAWLKADIGAIQEYFGVS